MEPTMGSSAGVGIGSFAVKECRGSRVYERTKKRMEEVLMPSQTDAAACFPKPNRSDCSSAW